MESQILKYDLDLKSGIVVGEYFICGWGVSWHYMAWIQPDVSDYWVTHSYYLIPCLATSIRTRTSCTNKRNTKKHKANSFCGQRSDLYLTFIKFQQSWVFHQLFNVFQMKHHNTWIYGSHIKSLLLAPSFNSWFHITRVRSF
jgi:hypothetical protein